MNPDSSTAKNGFVVAADEGPAFWFLNTLTINKVSATDTEGRLSIVDHRVPPGFAPPPHIHQASDEALLILDGEVEGFCGDQVWQAGPGSLVFLPHGIPHGFHVSQAGPGRSQRGPGRTEKVEALARLGEPAEKAQRTRGAGPAR